MTRLYQYSRTAGSSSPKAPPVHCGAIDSRIMSAPAPATPAKIRRIFLFSNWKWIAGIMTAAAHAIAAKWGGETVSQYVAAKSPAGCVPKNNNAEKREKLIIVQKSLVPSRGSMTHLMPSKRKKAAVMGAPSREIWSHMASANPRTIPARRISVQKIVVKAKTAIANCQP